MSEENKERACIACGKKLLDEKIPICLRCKLKGRNTVAKTTEIVGGIVTLIGAAAITNNHNGENTPSE
jgi:hypothetical protein